jgi:hypothetical protein
LVELCKKCGDILLFTKKREEKLCVCNLFSKIQALIEAYWTNQCPECGNKFSNDFCEVCEQDLSVPSVWIGLVDITLDNFCSYNLKLQILEKQH